MERIVVSCGCTSLTVVNLDAANLDRMLHEHVFLPIAALDVRHRHEVKHVFEHRVTRLEVAGF